MTVKNGTLRISGERKADKEEKDKRYADGAPAKDRGGQAQGH